MCLYGLCTLSSQNLRKISILFPPPVIFFCFRGLVMSFFCVAPLSSPQEQQPKTEKKTRDEKCKEEEEEEEEVAKWTFELPKNRFLGQQENATKLSERKRTRILLSGTPGSQHPDILRSLPWAPSGSRHVTKDTN